MVMSEYIDNKINITKIESDYDSKLLNSTHDAIKAYQLNTVNNAFGEITTEQVKDVESAAKTFYNSLTSNFNYSGYNSDVMRDYVPAIVFTMYDGYYIYSPFNNALTQVKEGEAGGYDPNYSKDGEFKTGLKPYVYYSCKYVKRYRYKLYNHIYIR